MGKQPKQHVVNVVENILNRIRTIAERTAKNVKLLKEYDTCGTIFRAFINLLTCSSLLPIGCRMEDMRLDEISNEPVQIVKYWGRKKLGFKMTDTRRIGTRIISSPVLFIKWNNRFTI